jgi:hypothetical protein
MHIHSDHDDGLLFNQTVSVHYKSATGALSYYERGIRNGLVSVNVPYRKVFFRSSQSRDGALSRQLGSPKGVFDTNNTDTGTGCPKCRQLTDNDRQAINELGAECEIEKYYGDQRYHEIRCYEDTRAGGRR